MRERELDTATEWAVARLRDWIPIESVSTEARGLEEGAAFTRALLQEAGLASRTLPGAGAPVVVGTRPGPPGAPSVLIYGHYDVQPADPVDAWTVAPFAGEALDGAVWGRGAGDNKGQLLAHVAAVRDLIARGELPVGITFLVEGEEEIGSPRLGEVVGAARDEIDADVALTSDAPGRDDGRPVVIFGVRGLLYVEIEHRGASRDVHSGNRGGVAPMPAWELVEALAALRRPDGTIALPGFEEAIRSPTAAEEAMLARLPDEREALRRELDVDRLAAGAEPDPWRALMFRPTCNLAGIWGGYQGPGAKTIVPHRATCKIDFRLVADQDPDTVTSALKRFLAERLPGVRVRRIASVPPSASDPAHPLCRAVVRGVEAAHDAPPVLRPRLGGTTPDWVFTRLLGLPSVLLPYGPADMNHHAPDERMTIAALRDGIATSVSVYRAIAGAWPTGEGEAGPAPAQ